MNAQWLLYGSVAVLALVIGHVVLPGMVAGPMEVVVSVLKLAGGAR